MNNKYNIYIYEDLEGESFRWSLDMNMFISIYTNNNDELREKLINMNVGTIDLKYLDISNNSQSELNDLNILVWDFNHHHFDWLIKEELDKIKFIEIISKR